MLELDHSLSNHAKDRIFPILWNSGIILKASNFKCLGNGKGADVIMYQGKSYHDKTIRTKYKGELKPFAKRIKDALESGGAFYKKTAGKVTYVYDLK